MIFRIYVLLTPCLFACFFSFAQPDEKNKLFTHADTLRGSLNENRDWWDVLRYDLTVTPDIAHKTIAGATTITFRADRDGKKMQIDLQRPMIVDRIDKAVFQQDGNVTMVTLDNPVKKGSIQKITIYYHGQPVEPVNPPWQGGWVWQKDRLGRPWISVACQGDGASIWYPCKDHQSDEPDDGASLTVVVPDTLVAIGNGRLVSKKIAGNNASYTWAVKNPINNYLIIPYIGKYVNFTDTLQGEKGVLDISYWVLDYNLEKAREHFVQVKQMLRAFEYWFGPYPFYEDSYKLVDAPFLGMEHQSAIAYGNRYINGYLGKDLSLSGWGLKWDYIIVHESGHEWFGNNITTKDIADSWVHEGFANYSEVLFTEYYYGQKAATDYCYGLRRGISNEQPIIGHYGVNEDGSGDMYSKGANLLHTLRHAINNDEKFRQILRGLNSKFYHQTVSSSQVESYISQEAGFDFSRVFDQYLRTTEIPQLEIRVDSAAGTVAYRWTHCVNGFNLPLVISAGQGKIFPTEQWQTSKVKKEDQVYWSASAIERMYYIRVNKMDQQ
ncbi:MAG TPA: M1 family metallopeptidase [Puia sp.]|nr:M1 family metallopeptidase [Puia sp.]